MAYGIASRDYLSRAEERLADQRLDSLFYAAFELRCGIEARMREYLDAWEHVSKKQKKGWRIVDLGKNVEKVFRVGGSIVRWAVHDRGTGKLILCLYHTPVSRKLLERGQRLGNCLHTSKKHRSEDDPWWTSLREQLLETARELRVANTGTLLGPPLMKSGTSEVHMKLELPPGVDPREVMNQMMHRERRVDVRYLRALPSDLETEALVWPRVS